MERVTTFRTPRWALGVLVGVITVSWIAMPSGSAPTTPGAALALAATTTAGPTRVTGVELGGVGPQSVVVLIKTDQKVESYESFSLPDPPRLVIDIPNAVHAAPGSLKAAGPIREIRSSQYRTQPVRVVRIVLDLTSKLPYQIEAAPHELQVAIGEAALAAGRPDLPAIAQAAPGNAPEEELPRAALPQGQVHGIDYLPQDGQAKILVRTSGDVTFTLVERQVPPGLIVDISGAVIDPQAAKVLDVRQVPGPVERIQASQHSLEPDRLVRIVADLKGNVRHEAVQTPQGISLSLQGVSTVVAAPPAVPEASMPQPAPVAAPPAPAPVMPAVAPAPVAPLVEPPAAAEVARLSMDFKDADVNNLLRIIAEVSGQNVVAGDDVKGRVTVRLVDVPWDRALDNILRINGLGFVREDNIIRVARMDAIRREIEERRKELQDDARLEEEGALEPLASEILRVSYADPKKIEASLNRIKSKRGTISVDERTASLIIQDTSSNIHRMKDVLRELDQPTPQVMIEGRIVTVASTHTRSLGVQWGFQRTHVDGRAGVDPFVLSQVFGDTGALLPTGSTTGGGTPAITAGVPAAVNLPIAGPAGALGVVLGKVNDTLRVQAQLSALERESLARTLSTPRIVALNNEEAIIKQGEQIPFTTVDSSGRTTVAFQEALLSLTVTPQVTADRRIQLKVKATDDTRGERFDFAGGFAIAINKNEATSSLLIDNGSTVVIGGVRKRSETTSEDKVPFLGNIPVLGWLFKNRSENIQPTTNELLIFITPTILDPTQVRR